MKRLTFNHWALMGRAFLHYKVDQKTGRHHEANLDGFNDALKTLTKREQLILEWRAGLVGNDPMTLQAIGNVLGVSRSRVREIEDKALRKLRHPSRTRKIYGL